MPSEAQTAQSEDAGEALSLAQVQESLAEARKGEAAAIARARGATEQQMVMALLAPPPTQ